MLRRLKGDDLDTLITRIEPPLTRAHSVIGNTAETVTFKSQRKSIALLDEETKSYLEAKPSGRFETLDTNVTSFNLLTGNGRVFEPNEAETVAFSLSNNLKGKSRSALIASMEHYDLGHKGIIRIVAERVETDAARLKKLIITSAEEIPASDWADGLDPMRSRR